MSSGLRESKHFARRQRRRRLLKYGFVLAFLAGFGAVSFGTGRELSESALRQARQEIARLNSAKAALERQNAALRTAAETARLERAELQRRYAEDVPKGPSKALFELVRDQLSQGAKADRLRFLIAAAGHKRKCDGQPVTKRFIVRTPLYDGAATTVTFAESALTVTASGEAAENADGRVQAWFDPARPVTIEIARLGEAPKRLTGTLPIQHALVVNNHEYRFSFVPGNRQGFANATVDRCAFP